MDHSSPQDSPLPGNRAPWEGGMWFLEDGVCPRDQELHFCNPDCVHARHRSMRRLACVYPYGESEAEG